jgi:hypothetical protein
MQSSKVLLSVATAGTVMFAPSFVAAPSVRVEPMVLSKSADNYASPVTATTRVFSVRAHTSVGGNVKQSPKAVAMAKLEMLRSLGPGWDGPGSLPLDDSSSRQYLEFLSKVMDTRTNDAEPLLTDEGLIRLEWRSNGFSYSAEIGPDSLYMCALAPRATDDDDEELNHYDLDRLLRFFERGELR